MNWHQALQLAQALLEEMGFDPYKVIAQTPDDLADTLCNLEENLTEALLTFFELLHDTTEVREAIQRFATSPKGATDLAKWQVDSNAWCCSLIGTVK